MSLIRERIERAVHGVMIGGFVGALASGIPGVLVGITCSAGMLGGLVLLMFGAFGIGGGLVGGAVAGLCVAEDGAEPARRKPTWRGRLLLASPILISLALFLTVAPFRFRRADPAPPFVPVIHGPGVAPDRSPALEPFVFPFQEFLDNHRVEVYRLIGQFIVISAFVGPVVYGALIGGRTVRALILWDESDKTGADLVPFSPGVEAIKHAKPTDPGTE